MRTATPKATKETLKQGDAATALANAAKKVEASYEFPFQSHATMDPGCAVADVRMDGVTTVWSGVQKPHAVQNAFAELLGLPLDKVRVIWVEDAGSYGRPGYEDAAADAVLLSQAVGRPVRGVQWMRADMTAWGTKGPAVICDLTAGFDARGVVTALQFTSRAFSGNEVSARPSRAGNYLAAQLSGIPNTSGTDEFAEWGVRCPPYAFRESSRGRARGSELLRHDVAAAFDASQGSRGPSDLVRGRVVHRRSGGGRRGRSDRVPAETHRRAQSEGRADGGR